MLGFISRHSFFLNGSIFVDEIKSLRGKVRGSDRGRAAENSPGLAVRPLIDHDEAIRIRDRKHEAEGDGRKAVGFRLENRRTAVRDAVMALAYL